MKTLTLYRIAFACLVAPASFPAKGAPGFPEPPLVFYGMVTQEQDGYSVPVLVGNLVWTITSSGGTPVVVDTSLTATEGGFSYRLEVPVEKIPAGSTLSVNALPATGNSYTRDPITLEMEPVKINSPALPGGMTFFFDETQRGRIERVDLAIFGGFLDTDGDGLPDWWEDAFGYDKYNPGDRGIDRDGDGVDTFDEYLAKTDPNGLSSITYPQWAVLNNLTGPNYLMTADLDSDGVPHGIEFALDANPNASDTASVNARTKTTTENIGGMDFLVMSVLKPTVPRAGILQTIEASEDLLAWGSREGIDIVTLQNDSTILKVRLKKSRDDPGANAGFMRFRVIESP